jgi:LmbE family N-acetylglucosaminyl deacetylase
LGASFWLQHHPSRCQVVHLTDGAPEERRLWPPGAPATRQAYAELRRAQAQAALRVAGLAPEQLWSLGVKDLEAAHALVPAATRLALLLEALRPDVIVTHAYEGGHPDHDAAAFVAWGAQLLLRRSRVRVPRIVEIASYHAAFGELRAGHFLQNASAPSLTLRLDRTKRALKARMLAEYAVPSESRELERFRAAPEYDFTQAPHSGLLHYERLGWGLSGARWRALAAEAMARMRVASSATEPRLRRA